MGASGEFFVRAASVDDVRVLAELRFRMFKEIAPEADMAPSIVEEFVGYFAKAIPDGRYIAFLAEASGVVVGASGTAIVEVPPLPGAPDGRVARVQGVYVLPEWRLRGVARALLSATLDSVRSAGIGHVALMATDAGRKLYQEFGFTAAHEMVLDLEI